MTKVLKHIEILSAPETKIFIVMDIFSIRNCVKIKAILFQKQLYYYYSLILLIFILSNCPDKIEELASF